MTINVRQLTKRFGEKAAVDNVSFDVGEGEFFVLVGPSGCGKTTTLRMIAGLEAIDGGELSLGGRAVNEIRPRTRNIAMVFQDYAIFPHLNVKENIAYGLRSRRVPSSVINARVPDAAKTFRIDHLLKRKPRQLSGGERQRVALARALVRDAQAYLYDEPLSNLDAQLRHQARDDILELHHRQKKPTVYVTHDQSEAMAMADRVAVMRGGRIQQIGTPRDIYEHPASLFVAHFIGTPSINIFDAELTAEGEDVLAEAASFTLRLLPGQATKLASHVGRSVKIGVRPEDLYSPRQASFEVTADNTIQATVTLIEPTTTGSTVYLTVPAADEEQDIAATFPARLPDRYMGEEVPLAVDMTRLHVFDAETEGALLTGAATT